MHSKRNHKQNEKTTHRIRENIRKQCNRQGINLQILQTPHAAQYKRKKKWAEDLSSVHSLSHVRLFVMAWTAAHQASVSISNSWSLFKLMSIDLVMPSNHPTFCRPLLLRPSIFPNIRVFANESVLRIRWPKYWSFSISPSNEHTGLVSFRMDWLHLLAVQGTLKSLLQHHSSKASYSA